MSSRRRSKFTSAEVESHFIDMLDWLSLESEAEVERLQERRRTQQARDAERSGETLLDLVIRDHHSGLGGMQLVTFEKRKRIPLPWHRLKAGSPVVVSSEDGSRSETGVISHKTPEGIEVALNRLPEGHRFRVDLTVDEVTRQRQRQAVHQVLEAGGRLGKLRDILMGEREPEFDRPPEALEFRTQLNEPQQEAVRWGLQARDLAIIHGPPGTGKTTTVVELIAQAVARGQRVLACAPSNTAVDNLLERLLGLNQAVIRIGHPARVSRRLQRHTVDGRVTEHESASIIREIRREAEALLRQSDKWTRAKRPRGQRGDLRREARELENQARRLERQAIDWVLDDADVICATTTFNGDLLGDRWFDLVVIDEACQSTEPGSWVPLLRGDRVVLAGDPQQLPPTVLSAEAARAGFAVSLMERQMNLWGEQVTRLLTRQYRMHRDIMTFSSQQFYGDQLVADPSVATHRLSDLAPGIDPLEPVVNFIDSAGAGWDEELEPEGLSKRNPEEARLVLQVVQQWLDAGLSPRDIAVIAPYAAQVRLLRDGSPHRDLEIDTVDGFQGREKEAVVISLVRSNPTGEIGFLADRRRMNVALTRARRKLVVVGDSATLGGDPFYQALVDYMEQQGGYRSVWELMSP